ncbi:MULTISPECIES: periplasmic heavy metal sensor [unclassified Rhizobium]|uniref:periplasmic heavy metal sensor n=1 Tax=unclassified Rhizobium TaxID=2613769 RepID=UPI00161BA613|nr:MULTISPECIES: periplasmic heavy metal sensor [unclassified Rhizobium]MBB3289402.1 putative membrane protein [Rhizobium sp. BK252]MBB3404198.1 putative membrane protein [Rhizobium sp. BK289]MBB3416729.1 putative membrane protein [Rhizobium sp. BK284]MBB3484607.1 putative membrane protein [Rhizobium sp. BK347]MDK4721183.1 periplasmic heavy metal sensor [Rhizobium sp. CNPSo 3968]
MTDRSFRIVVISLLVLNTFLIGALAGGGLTWIRKTQARAGMMPLAGEQLPSVQKKALRAALNEARKDNRQAILEAQQAKVDAASILGQPMLDKEALLAALARARNADIGLRTKLEERAVDFAATLSYDERRALAESLVRRSASRAAATK